MKKYLTTIIAVAVCAGMLFYILHFERGPKKDETAKAKAAIFAFAKDDALKIEINVGGVISVLEKKGAAWNITRPEPMRANARAVDDLLAVLSEYKADRVIEEKAADLKKYGLDKPAATVTVFLKGNKSLVLKIGKDTPVDDAYYAASGDSARVYQVAKENVAVFAHGVDSLRDKSVADLASEDAAEITVADKDKSVSCEKDKDGKWYFKGDPNKKDEKKRSCDEAAFGLVDAVVSAQVKQFQPPGEDAASFGLKSPGMTINIVTGDKKTVELQLGSVYTDKDIFLRNIQRNEVYQVEGTLDEVAVNFLKASAKLQ